jgi:hypothetical protein
MALVKELENLREIDFGQREKNLNEAAALEMQRQAEPQ